MQNIETAHHQYQLDVWDVSCFVHSNVFVLSSPDLQYRGIRFDPAELYMFSSYHACYPSKVNKLVPVWLWFMELCLRFFWYIGV